jgi:RNA polymerase sigma-70 factor (ECF subfamily)
MLKRKRSDCAALSDIELAGRIAAKDVAAVRLVTGKNNQRLYRTAWSILKIAPKRRRRFRTAT